MVVIACRDNEQRRRWEDADRLRLLPNGASLAGRGHAGWSLIPGSGHCQDSLSAPLAKAHMTPAVTEDTLPPGCVM